MKMRQLRTKHSCESTVASVVFIAFKETCAYGSRNYDVDSELFNSRPVDKLHKHYKRFSSLASTRLRRPADDRFGVLVYTLW